MATVSPAPNKHKLTGVQLLGRLQNCWSKDIDWDKYPVILQEGCRQVGKAICIPPTAVLYGLITVTSFAMSHSVIEVADTDWVEPVLVWIAICMPTGSGKTSLCKILWKLIDETRANVVGDSSPTWMADDQSLEKLGVLMSENNGRLLGLYDELAMFFSQKNIFHGKSVTDSRELSVFLQFFGAKCWSRKTVSGEANFDMKRTGLTLGGFMQPSIARNLLEQQSSVEKGLCQRVLWCVPKPSVASFQELEKVDQQFCASIVTLSSSLWRNERAVKWILPKDCTVFSQKFDAIQNQLQAISCKDELLSGMLSKSKGQVLRVAAVLHVLFHMETPLQVSDIVEEAAVKAAIDLVDVCVQHAAYLAGRGNIQDAIEELSIESMEEEDSGCNDGKRSAITSLLLPGRILDLKALSVKRVYRNSGNKSGAVSGFQKLEEASLGKIQTTKLNRGANMLYKFEKASIPDNNEEKLQFVEQLMKFGVSLAQYEKALMMDDITLDTIEVGMLSLLHLHVAQKNYPMCH